ncbi:hypothetical protein BFP70_01640 [Thioclava sp. SK-1]|uniref:DUF4123 domain-containing protein n=1 Tax=Thioclava sp. SK-1 TaxID=1889770 RepID=UPI000826F634|nr:DUF4123 domain-containing protein [Thioclava sp. SK-1]OCX67322.1 hypothetical protein BFP70_01640 [Thioclava sp. SK-1]
MLVWDNLRSAPACLLAQRSLLEDDLAPDGAHAEDIMSQMRNDTSATEHMAPGRIYALIDGARSLFLPERLEVSGLEHVCLYEHRHLSDEGATAPWLVELDPNSKFARATFMHDAQGLQPRAMFGAGIWLTSRHDLNDLRAHLRRYTQVTDERGATEFFRLAEPGMLDALLYASNDAEVSAFFSSVSHIFYPWPALEAGRFSIQSVTAQVDGAARVAVPAIDAKTRRVFEDFVTDRTARRMAVDCQSDPRDRADAYPIFMRLLRAGFDHEPRLQEAFDLLRKMPPEGHAPFWTEVESGNHSLRRIMLVYRDHYQIEGVLE